MEAVQRDTAGGQAEDPCFEMIETKKTDNKAKARSSTGSFLKQTMSAICTMPRLLRHDSRSRKSHDEDCTPLLKSTKSSSRSTAERKPWNSSQVLPAPYKEFPAPTAHSTFRPFNAHTLTPASPPENAGPASTPAKTARSGLSPSNARLPDPQQKKTLKHPGSSAPVIPKNAPNGRKGTPVKRALSFMPSPNQGNESDELDWGDAPTVVGPEKGAVRLETGSGDKFATPSTSRREATAAHRELDLATEHIQELQSALQTERAAAAAQDSSAQNAADERARLQRDLDALTGELRAQTAALLHEKRQLTEALESKKRAAETAQALVRNEMQQCNTLSLDLEKENARRTKWETTADQERKKREEGDKALHEAAKTVARLEAALAEARDGAAAAAREREEAEARLATELVKTKQLAAYQNVNLETLEERASAKARSAEAAARLAAAEDRAASAETLATQARALARKHEETIEALARERAEEAEKRRKEGAWFAEALGRTTKELDTLTEELAQERKKAEAAETRFLEAEAEAESVTEKLDCARKETLAAADLLTRLETEKQELENAHNSIMTEKELLAKTLERRARQAEEKDTLLTQLSERAAVVLREKEQAEAAVKAAAGEADAAAAKLQALQFRLQEAEEANGRAEGRAMAAALSEETERRAAEEKLTDGERRLEAEMAKRREADAKAAKQEARGDELAQQLVAAEATRALLVAKVREAERLAEENAHALQATQAADIAAAVREADLRFQLAMATSAVATWQAKAQLAQVQLTEADAAWRAEKERLEAAASFSSDTWQADVHRLEAALAAAESQCRELKERSEGLEARLAELEKQADAVVGREGRAVVEAAAAREEAAAARQDAEAGARREAELRAAYEKLQAEIAKQKQVLAQARASLARTIADLKKDVATHRSKVVELEKKITDASTSETALLEEALAKQRSRHQQEMQDAAAKERSTSTALEASRRAVSTLRNEKAALDEIAGFVVLRQKLQDNTIARERKAEMQVDILKDEIKELKQKAHEAYMHIKALSADRTRTFGRSALPASFSVSASPRSILDLDGDAKTFSSTGCAK